MCIHIFLTTHFCFFYTQHMKFHFNTRICTNVKTLYFHVSNFSIIFHKVLLFFEFFEMRRCRCTQAPFVRSPRVHGEQLEKSKGSLIQKVISLRRPQCPEDHYELHWRYPPCCTQLPQYITYTKFQYHVNTLHHSN